MAEFTAVSARLDKDSEPGLTTDTLREWPKGPDKRPDTMPIQQFLAFGTENHSRILDYLIKRLEASENAMNKFYARWRVNEGKYQAYIDLPEYEKILDQMNKEHKAPQVVEIQVPYSFATINTISTYLVHTFCGRKPTFQVGANNPAFTQNAMNMQQVLQYNSEHARLVRHMFRFIQDQQIYGVGVLRTAWKNETALRTRRRSLSQYDMQGMVTGSRFTRQRENTLIYSGNDLDSVDPFMFFPDPRVPMSDVNRRGEYVFWRSYQGKHFAKNQEIQGAFFQVDKCTASLPQNKLSGESNSARNLLSQGESTPGATSDGNNKGRDFFQIDQGTVEIIPAELGLGPETYPQKWLFTVLNKAVIVQAQPFDADHGMHPVVVSEPYEVGYGFGNPGISDYLNPLQDTISWFVNSHIHNVRTALNNMFVVDPSMIEMQDARNPAPGKFIRLKRAAYGQDVRTAISQLQVFDATQKHVDAVQTFIKMGQYLTGVTDNLMGINEEGGRKTAAEVRISSQAGASRLAFQARAISAQAFIDLAQQMSLNLQQYLDDKFYYYLTGDAGQLHPLKVGLDEIQGDFNYPIMDGTLPMDNVALLNVWKEILTGVAGDQQIRSTYDFPSMFEFVAQLGGATNIQGFKIKQLAPGQAPAPGAMPLNPAAGAAALTPPAA